MLNPLLAIIAWVIVTFSFSLALVKLFTSYALKKGMLDSPNHRSSHTIPTPRGGGIAFVAVWFASGIFFLRLQVLNPEHLVLFLGAFSIAFLGYWDDLHSLSPLTRASGHILISSICILSLGGMADINLGDRTLHLGIWGTPLAILALAWSINLYNFMDGTDGLAALEGFFIFLIFGTMVWMEKETAWAGLVWLLAGSLSGFLFWNWPKAKVFMGDGGSGFLGFVIPLFAIIGEKKYGLPALLWLIPYSTFFIDTSITVVRRALAGEKWYCPHRSHAYQRLHQAGWNHQKILFAFIPINLFLGALTFWAYHHRGDLNLCLSLSLALSIVLYLLIERKRPYSFDGTISF